MLARTKQPPTLPTLPERIRAAAGKVRELDVELKGVVEAYIDEQKASCRRRPASPRSAPSDDGEQIRPALDCGARFEAELGHE